MNEEMKVLDHGYVKLIETYGSDSSIIEAARMSTGKGFLGWGTPESKGDENDQGAGQPIFPCTVNPVRRMHIVHGPPVSHA